MEKIILKPEALFCLGKKMNGLYYNYDYYNAIPAVEDNDGNKLLWRMESELAEQGVLVENDDGDLVPTEEVSELVRPVFFGPFQAKIVFSPEAKENEGYLYYLHWLEGGCRLVAPSAEGYTVLRLDDDKLTSLVVSFLPEGYTEKEAPPADLQLDAAQITQRLSAGSSAVGGEEKTLAVINCGGWLCEVIGENEVNVLSPAAFVEKLLKIIKEDA